jgi:hypothetical protein
MSNYRVSTRSSDDRWRQHGTIEPMQLRGIPYREPVHVEPWRESVVTRSTPRFDVRLLLSRHEITHARHCIKHHVEVSYATVEGEHTSRGYCAAHTLSKDNFADPFDRVVNSLVGPASDLHFFNHRWDHETADHRDAIAAAKAIDANNWEAIIRRGEKVAAEFVRDHEDEIIAIADRLYQKGEMSGIQIRVLLQRAGVDKAFNEPGPRPKRKKKDLKGVSESVDLQESEDLEEIDEGIVEEEDEDTMTTEDGETIAPKKKKKKRANAGRIGDAYYRTDGVLGGFVAAGGVSVRSNREPDPQVLYERARHFWATGE